jgi:hypothetical protein
VYFRDELRGHSYDGGRFWGLPCDSEAILAVGSALSGDNAGHIQCIRAPRSKSRLDCRYRAGNISKIFSDLH